MKKLLSSTLAFVLCLTLLASCAGEAAPETPATTEEPTTSTSEATGTDTAAPADGDGAMGAGKDGAPTPENPVTFLLSHTFYVGNPLDIALKEVVANINERTGGSIIIELYDAASIANGADAIEQIVNGSNLINCTAMGAMADWVPEVAIFQAPFLIEDEEEFSFFCDSEFVDQLEAKAEEAGLKIIEIDYNFGMRHLATSETPVRTLDDIQNMKFRSFNQVVAIQIYEAMGANPVPMAWSDVYSALETGMIEGYDMPNGDDYDMGMHEVINYKTETGHSVGHSSAVMSLDLWNTLTTEQQDIMMEEFDAGAKLNNELIAEFEEVGRQGLMDEGVEIIEIDREEWFDHVQPFYEALPGWDTGFYDLAFEELEAYRAGNA